MLKTDHCLLAKLTRADFTTTTKPDCTLTWVRLQIGSLDKLHPSIRRFPKYPSAMSVPQPICRRVRIVRWRIGESGIEPNFRRFKRGDWSSPMMQAMPEHPPLDTPLEPHRSHPGEEDP
jgi:hypothetical protein